MNINKQDLNSFAKELKTTGKNLIKSQITLSIITLAVLTISFYFLNINNFFFVALGITLVDILPIIGSGIVMLPWSAYLIISQTDSSLGIKILGIYVLLTVVKQILEPLIRGKSLGLSPLMTAGSSIIGFVLFQGVGLIVGPIIAILTQTGYKIFVKNKELPQKRD